MLKAKEHKQFQRDVELAKRRNKDMQKLRAAATLLLSGMALPASYRDHSLRGKWEKYRELHIEGDWLLIYRRRGDIMEFARTGTHSDLFG